MGLQVNSKLSPSTQELLEQTAAQKRGASAAHEQWCEDALLRALCWCLAVEHKAAVRTPRPWKMGGSRCFPSQPSEPDTGWFIAWLSLQEILSAFGVVPTVGFPPPFLLLIKFSGVACNPNSWTVLELLTYFACWVCSVFLSVSHSLEILHSTYGTTCTVWIFSQRKRKLFLLSW